MKKIKVMFISLVLLFSTNLMYAEATNNPYIHSIDETIFYINENGVAEFNSDINIINLATRGLYYYMGNAKIQVSGNGQVLISGYTEANFAVNKVMLSLSLERYSNGKWIFVSNKFYESYNTDYVSGKEYCNVTKGSIYRVTGVFTVSHNGVVESNSGSTDGVTAN